jgi:hypothetical protein
MACAGRTPAEALCATVRSAFGLDISVSHESTEPLRVPQTGEDASLVAYVELTAGVSSPAFGVASGSSPLQATLAAAIRALNRLREIAPAVMGAVARAS